MTVPINDEKRAAVAQFLKEWNAVAACQRPIIIPREKNRDVLIELGLTLTDQWEILKNLRVEDYVSGPDPDHQRRGDFWVFGVFIGEVEIYIKIKLAEWIPVGSDETVRQAICVSFHIAERPLTYPLK